jgi:hypothetical protein
MDSTRILLEAGKTIGNEHVMPKAIVQKEKKGSLTTVFAVKQVWSRWLMICKLFVFRHAETTDNVRGLFSGAVTPDSLRKAFSRRMRLRNNSSKK